jgi:hypothetical protein
MYHLPAHYPTRSVAPHQEQLMRRIKKLLERLRLPLPAFA